MSDTDYNETVTVALGDIYDTVRQQGEALMRKANIEYIMAYDNCDEETAEIQDALGRNEVGKYFTARSRVTTPMPPNMEGNLKVSVHTELIPNLEETI